MKQLLAGQRFYYTGDAANGSSFGTITEVLQPDKYAPLRYKVQFDNERFEGDKKESTVYALGFEKGAGQRFKTIEQYNEEHERTRQYYKERFPHLNF